MPDRRDKAYTIRRVEEIEALQSPMRQQIVAVMEREDELTVAEMADALGMTPESVYYHVRTLLDVGLLVECGTRPGKRRPSAVYRLVARTINTDPSEHAPAFLRSLVKLYESCLRLALRNLSHALENGNAVRGGPRRNCIVQQYNVRLTPGGLRELNARLRDLALFLAENDDPDAEGFYSVTTVLTPNRVRTD